MKTSSLAIFLVAVAIPFGPTLVSAAPGLYRQRTHNPPSCEDMAEMKNQRSSLIDVLGEISAENELAATIATWEAEKKSRQQQNLEANCGGGRARLLRGVRGRQQNRDGNGANCDGGEDCERQRLGPQMNGNGDRMGRKGAGGLFDTDKCDGEGCGKQRGDGQGRGGGERKGSNGLFAILRDTTCEDGDIEDIDEILEAIDELAKNDNQPAMRLDRALEAFVDDCESD